MENWQQEYIQLHDYDSLDVLGLITCVYDADEHEHEKVIEEIEESWTDFNKLAEHNKDYSSVTDFVEWHNKNWNFQIERIQLTKVVPD